MTFQVIAQILGALGVITSFVYAGVQVRRNTLAVRAGSYLQVTGAFANTWLGFARDTDMIELILKAGDNFDALDRVQKARFRFASMGYLRQIESAYFLHRLNILKDSDWQGVLGDVNSYFSLAGTRKTWPLIRHTSGEDFRAFVQAIVDRENARAAAESKVAPA